MEHVVGVVIVTHTTVDATLDVKVVRVSHLVAGSDAWSHGRERVERLTEKAATAKASGGNIESGRVAEYIVHCALRRHVLRRSRANYKHKLGFMVKDREFPF